MAATVYIYIYIYMIITLPRVVLVPTLSNLAKAPLTSTTYYSSIKRLKYTLDNGTTVCCGEWGGRKIHDCPGRKKGAYYILFICKKYAFMKYSHMSSKAGDKRGNALSMGSYVVVLLINLYDSDVCNCLHLPCLPLFSVPGLRILIPTTSGNRTEYSDDNIQHYNNIIILLAGYQNSVVSRQLGHSSTYQSSHMVAKYQYKLKHS
uniref:FLYWCH-type domain-containing protein n=1 Tax=Heterorhabditis bacteriophora TaxID=37862 RepID=A0A1I7W6B5_HETBA